MNYRTVTIITLAAVAVAMQLASSSLKQPRKHFGGGKCSAGCFRIQVEGGGDQSQNPELKAAVSKVHRELPISRVWDPLMYEVPLRRDN